MGPFSVGRTGSALGGCGVTSTGADNKGVTKTQMGISKMSSFIFKMIFLQKDSIFFFLKIEMWDS